MTTKEFLKCLLLSISCAVAISAFAVLVRIDSTLSQLQSSLPQQLNTSVESFSKHLDSKIDPLLTQYANTGHSLNLASQELTGLIKDVRTRIPVFSSLSSQELTTINSSLDKFNSSISALSRPLEPLQPTVDGLNQMFRRDELPKSVPSLVRDYRRVGDEIAQTMITVRNTVNQEAPSTAEAIRESAQGTAKTTAGTAEVTATTETLLRNFNNLLFGPKTWRQKLWAIIRLLVNPTAILVSRGL